MIKVDINDYFSLIIFLLNTFIQKNDQVLELYRIISFFKK